MTRNLKLVIFVLVSTSVAGFGWWRYQVGKQRHAAHGAILRDRSISSRNGCDCISNLADRMIALPGMGDGSTLTLLSTGDQATVNEPILLGRHALPENRMVMEGRPAYILKKEQLLASVREECDRAAPTGVSPLFLAIKRGIEHLTTAGCGSESDCYLFVQTDGEENSNLEIKKALNDASRRSSTPIAKIENDHIRIVFIGMAEKAAISANAGRRGNTWMERDPRRIDRLREVWASVFTRPSFVTFEPYCVEAEKRVEAYRK